MPDENLCPYGAGHRFKLDGTAPDVKYFSKHEIHGEVDILKCTECGETRFGVMHPKRYVYRSRSKY